MTPSQPLLRADEAPAARTLVDVFAESVAAFPDATALDSGQERLTYAELAEAADELADELAARGVGRGDRVGVRLPSGTTDLYVAILGILHAGAAYVPVDADDPDERARLVFGEAGVASGPGSRSSSGVPPRRASARSRASGTTPGSSSPPARPARPRAWRSRTATPRRSSTPRHGCSSRTTRSARRTG